MIIFLSPCPFLTKAPIKFYGNWLTSQKFVLLLPCTLQKTGCNVRVDAVFTALLQYLQKYQTMVPEKTFTKLKPNRPEERIIELMTQQYYNYISLLKLTNNFEKKLSLYQDIDLDSYESRLAVVGNISEISTDQKNTNYIFPVVSTPINRYLFSHQGNCYSRRPHNPIKRKLAIRQQNYIKALILPFNKIISMSKKQKDQFFIFTHLDIYLKDGKQLYFALTEQTHIIQLENQFYKAVLQPIEASLETNYSEINLNTIFPNGALQRGSTFAVNEVKNKINENINTYPIMGRLRKIHRESYEKSVNAKEKEVILDIVQDIYPCEFTSLGLCRIYVRFDILDQEQMEEHMQEGCIYVFQVNEVDLNKNLQLNFKLNHWKNNMLRVTREPLPPLNLEEKYKSMKIGNLATLTYPVIFRNHYKYRVVKTDIKFMNLKVICEKCGGSVLRLNEEQYRCRNQCGDVRGDLKFWVIIGCMDQSGYAEMTLEDGPALVFFNLEAEVHRIKDEVLKEESEPGKAITLYFKRNKENTNEDEFQDGLLYDKNPYLLRILNQCQVGVIEKEVVTYVKPATNDTFHNFEEGVKNQFQSSFARSKEYIKKAKIFLNGQFRTFSDRTRLVPHLKAERVYPVSTVI